MVTLSAEKHRFHLLDALRGIAAILVVYWHAPLYLGLQAGHLTYIAVDFFFCLSGFVIAYTYQDRLNLKLTLLAFTKTRLIRLYPVFLFGVVLGSVPLVVGHIGHHPSAHDIFKMTTLVASQLVMVPNLGSWPNSLFYPSNFPGWSIFFELVANIAFAVLVRTRRANTMILSIVYLVSLGGLLFLVRSHDTLNFGWNNEAWQVVGGFLRVSLSFVGGILIYRLYRRIGSKSLSFSSSVISGILVCCALILLLQKPLPWLPTSTWGVLVITLIFPVLIWLGAHAQVPARTTKICALLGDLSYPVYLTHAPLFSIFELPRLKGLLLSNPTLQVWVVPITICASAVLSFVLLKVYDEPLREWLRARSKSSIKLSPTTPSVRR